MNWRFDPKYQPAVWLALLLGIGNGLWLAPDGTVVNGAGALLVLLLPGLILAWVWRLGDEPLFRWGMGLGLGYALLIFWGLLLHYWPGPLTVGMVWGLFNLLSLLGLGWLIFWPATESLAQTPRWLLLGLLAILLVGAAFRFINLGYSEFDGDEVKALIPAAAAIEGRVEALFDQRKKGPGEIIVPMLVWRLSGLVTESLARLPFAVAGVLAIWLIFLLGRAWFGEAAGLLAALLLALNGLMVAFARIVQYQQVVVVMSLLALLTIWRWRSDGRAVWWPLAGLFVAIGLLSHYDALLVLPPLAFLAVVGPKTGRLRWSSVLAGGAVLAAVTALFGLPYLLAASTSRTGAYLEQRIGAEWLKNQLHNFFHINSFYSSFYYVVLVCLLALIFLALALARLPRVKRWPARRYWLPGGVIAGSLLVTTLSAEPGPALLWFGLILAGAIIAPGTPAERATLIWLAVTFIGYNFLVATPRTHFYTVLPPLILLAALGALMLWRGLSLKPGWAALPLAGLLLVTGGYLTHAFLRPSVQYEFDWPASRLPFYWSPFDEPPPFDAYGFIHHSGWKAAGGLYLTGQLSGDYQTNGLTETAAWYTRHQLVGCYRQSRQFFGVASRLLDRRDLPGYEPAGQIKPAAGGGMDIYQPQSALRPLAAINLPELEAVFDRTAVPAAFVPPVQANYQTNVNLADAIQLTGYQYSSVQVKPGQQVAVTLHWLARKDIPLDLNVFVHLVDKNNPEVIWAQSTGRPGCGKQPTSGWKEGTSVDDLHLLTLDPTLLAGDYAVVVGMFLPGDNIRVPVFDETGHSVSESIELATIGVAPLN